MIETIVEGFRRQRENYRRMAELVAEERRLVESADPDALLDLVRRQRAVLEEIRALDRTLHPVRARWPELRARLDPAAAARVEEEAARARRALEDLLRREDEGGRGRQETAGAADAGRARAAYGGGAAW
ncbi:MAG TPA: flagellar export chaperone FlgN [Planctomycetota bacterium]|nr:flagellar export chaperone FlgN [Planctomycetota bacterium]